MEKYSNFLFAFSPFQARKFAPLPATAETDAQLRRRHDARHHHPGLPGNGLPRAAQLHPPGPGRQKLPGGLGKCCQGQTQLFFDIKNFFNVKSLRQCRGPRLQLKFSHRLPKRN